MSVRRKPAIARAFASAEDYDAHATIQRAAARRLAAAIAAHDLAPGARILEIGCGTGFLSSALVRDFPAANLLLTDLSDAMVGRSRRLIGDRPNVRYAALDGERPAFAAGSFDLICSSLAFQWFEDLAGALATLAACLAPGGRLAFTTLAEGSFAEWEAAHARAGLASATRRYPSSASLEAFCPPGCTIAIEIHPLVEKHSDGIAFLRALKAIGAHTPWRNRTPLPPGAMRRVLAAFADSGATVTYQVAHVMIEKAPGQA